MQMTSGAGRYPIAGTKENLRARDLAKVPELAAAFAGDEPFSVMIASGNGEIFMKKIDGRWHQRIDQVDKVFGCMRGRYLPAGV